jgi:hypothetical protein
MSPFSVDFEKFVDLIGESIFEFRGREAHLPADETVRIMVSHWDFLVTISRQE